MWRVSEVWRYDRIRHISLYIVNYCYVRSVLVTRSDALVPSSEPSNSHVGAPMTVPL